MVEYYKIITSFAVVNNPDYLVNGGHIDQGLIMLDKEQIINDCPFLKGAVELLLNYDPIGRVGNYKGVYELSTAIECYTPDDGSDPGEGTIGVEELMKVITFTTYCDKRIVNDNQIEIFINKLAEIHPWEHPVIQLHGNGTIKMWDKD